MITINDTPFYEEPGSCGTCPFLFIPGKNAPSFMPSGGSSGTHHCTLWDEWHHSWAACPRRCKKLFRQAFAYPDGYKLVIVAKEKE